MSMENLKDLLVSLPKSKLSILGEFEDYSIINDDDIAETEMTAHDVGFEKQELSALQRASLDLLETNLNITRSNVGGYHSSDNLFDGTARHHAFDALHLRLLDMARLKWNAKKGRQKDFPMKQYKSAEAWVNIMRDCGNHNDLHDHSGATYSGVFYLKVEEDTGALTVFRTCVDTNKNSCEYFAVTPKQNVALLWPSPMVHAVTPLEGKKKTRISISYNFYIGSSPHHFC